jgi:hypothetical protein
MRTVDIFLPQVRLLVHHDGTSHDRPMPVDREVGKTSKAEADREWDIEAYSKGLKALRLHWADEHLWQNYFIYALQACLVGDFSPLYTPHTPVAL